MFLLHLYKLSRTSMAASVFLPPLSSLSLPLSLSFLWAVNPQHSPTHETKSVTEMAKRNGCLPPPDFGFLMTTYFWDEICFFFGSFGKLMLHFDSLTGETPFWATLFKPTNIHIHNYKFSRTFFKRKKYLYDDPLFTN